jgi:hypothetical protein
VRRPPPPAQGLTTGPPDYVGLGAQRSGTSWWHQLVQDHPGVYRPPGLLKEVHFLDALGPPSSGRRRPEPRQYYDYFPRPSGYLVGEWTPRYLHDFWVPPLLARLAPRARILVILRDPVERFRSGLTLSLALSGGRNRKLLADDAFARGMYWAQLRWLFRWFDPSDVLVLQYEKCVRDPAVQLARTYRFLGLEPRAAGPDLQVQVNPTIGPKIALSVEERCWLRESYEADVAALVANVRGLDPRLWTDDGAG